jgi:hypothetical protein
VFLTVASLNKQTHILYSSHVTFIRPIARFILPGNIVLGLKAETSTAQLETRNSDPTLKQLILYLTTDSTFLGAPTDV